MADTQPIYLAICRTNLFMEQITNLCFKADLADVILVVESERFPVHKAILAARNKFFRALFFECVDEEAVAAVAAVVMSSADPRVITLRWPIELFKILLEYLYTGLFKLPSTYDSSRALLDMLIFLSQYYFDELLDPIATHLTTFFQLDNILNLLENALLYNLNDLKMKCFIFIDLHVPKLLKHATFRTLSETALVEIIQRDTFIASEVNIFLAVKAWHQRKRYTAKENVISKIRFQLMRYREFRDIVRPSNLVGPQSLVAYQATVRIENKPYRVCAEMNVLAEIFPATIIANDGGRKIEQRYHAADEISLKNFIIELDRERLINHVKFKFHSEHYWMHVSVDMEQWQRIFAHSTYANQSWQFLYFKHTLVRYIRFFKPYGKMSCIEAYYLNTIPDIIDGVVAPKYNIATLEMGALANMVNMKESSSLIPFNQLLIPGGITCSYECYGYIDIILGQPYYIDSMRMWLFAKCNFEIRLSDNLRDYTTVAVLKDLTEGWHDVKFDARPVAGVRLEADRSSLACLYFECPSQV